MFIGNSHQWKGYEILDLSTKIIFTSRDVSFVEINFPFLDYNKNEDPILLVSILPSYEDFSFSHNHEETQGKNLEKIETPNTPMPRWSNREHWIKSIW